MLKVRLSPYKKLFIFLPEKLLQFSGYSNFCLDILVIEKNDLANFKIHDVTTSLITTIDILLNLSGSKGNQTIKFGQLLREILFFKNDAEN